MAAFASHYAHSFLDVVTARKLDAAAIDRQLRDFLATWDGSRELREFFVNPAIPAKQKVEFLDKMNAQLGMQKELRNLLAVLIDNDRIGHVHEVAAATGALAAAAWHPAGADCDRPRAGQAGADGAEAEVAKLADSRIEAYFELDESILGGTVVRIGSTVYDGSVRGRLERLKEQLVSGQ